MKGLAGLLYDLRWSHVQLTEEVGSPETCVFMYASAVTNRGVLHHFLVRMVWETDVRYWRFASSVCSYQPSEQWITESISNRRRYGQFIDFGNKIWSIRCRITNWSVSPMKFRWMISHWESNVSPMRWLVILNFVPFDSLTQTFASF